VEAVVEGCRDLERFDVSQCKNLGRWVEAGGVESVKSRGRNVKFVTVSDGRWRDGRATVRR
jgi:F-box/leucine-rich repeat protein 7